MLSTRHCAQVIKFCNGDLESTPELTQHSVRVGKSVDGSDKSIDAAGWVDFQPTRQIDILNGFFHNPSHGCDRRSNIKKIQESDRLSAWTGKKSEATG